MAITLLAELFDSEGNKLGESFFGNLMSAKRWAGEENATFIRIYDTEAEDEEERETYYLKSGAKGQWNKTKARFCFSYDGRRNVRKWRR